MAFTPRSTIEQKRRLAQALRNNAGQQILPNVPSGLAYMINQYFGGKADFDAREAEKANETLRKGEMEQLRNVLSGGAAPPLKQGIMPSFSHPDTQALALQNEIDKQRHARSSSLIDQRQSDPSNVQEWQFFSQLSPDEQQQYLVMKRSGQTMNLGDRVVTPDPLNPGQTLAEFDVGLRPGETPEVRSQQAQAVADVEVEKQRRLASQEAEMALEQDKSRRQTLIDESEDKQAQMNTWIDEAINNANFFTTGFFGTMLEFIPGTPAYDLVAAVDSIKANVTFDKLQDMREKSPTGGALGQVSNFENQLMAATLGNLENSQSEEQFVQNLETLKDLLNQIVNRGISSFERDYGQEDIFARADAIIDGR